MQPDTHAADRQLRTRDVCTKLGISRATLGRYMRRPDFPKPIRYSRQLLVWPSSTIEAWLESMKAA